MRLDVCEERRAFSVNHVEEVSSCHFGSVQRQRDCLRLRFPPQVALYEHSSNSQRHDMTDRPPNTPLALRQRMMPSNRTAEHARHVLDRVTRGVPIPAPVYRHLLNLANSLEAGKSELKGHLYDRNAQIRHLKHELEKARTLQSDDGLIQLYNAGGKLISKQADEIKELKRELQRGKDERERLVPKLVEKDNQIAKVEDEKKNCREAMRRLQDRLAGLELGSPDSQMNPNRESAILKQRVEEYRKVADDQQKHIKKLTQENDRLVMALGRQHFNEMDLP
jgi:hypothetical protein